MSRRNVWSGFAVASLILTGAAAAQEPTRPPTGRSPLQRAFDEAFRAARATGDPAERTERLWLLACGQINQGRRHEALATMREALDAARATGPDSPHIIPHPIVRIAKSQAAAGDREAAHRTFQEAVRMIAAEDDDGQVQDWINLIPIQLAVESRAAMADTFKAYRRFCERHEPWGRDKLIPLDAALSGDVEQAVKEITARKIDNPKFGGGVPSDLEDWRCTSLLCLLSYFGRDERERIRPVLVEVRKLINTGIRRDFRPQRLQELAVQEARLGLFNAAIAMAESIDPSDADRPQVAGVPPMDRGSFKKMEAFAGIGSTRLEAGDYQGARRTARRAFEVAGAMKGRSSRGFLLFEATRVLIQTDDLDGAHWAVDSINWPPLVIQSLRRLARAEARQGDPARARASLTRALTVARESHQPITTIAEIQAEMGDVAGALKTAEAIEEGKRPDALHQIAQALAAAGRLEAAVSVVEKITTPAVRDQAWIDVACWAQAS